jgi:NAD(P)-dependent dehydrogenase (short-subunit alcohol dehydrogenase family)
MRRLENQIAIITGGGAGLGLAIAKRFLGSGAKVFINDVSTKNLSKASSVLIDSGINPEMFDSLAGDISKETDVKTLFSGCLSRFGACTILVNNAGIIQETPFHKISNEDWDKMIAVHLKGCFLGCQNALPSMLAAGGGIIINIASQLGQIGGYQLAHYSAAKAGIIGLTKSLALEYSNSGIRVNAIAPGPTNTDMVLKNLSKTWRKRKAMELPLGKFGEPNDVANTALFLATDDSKTYVGQTLGPNSGDVML